MSNPSHFDYIIIGNGLAGLQLALQLSEDSFFEQKQIALIDPSEKNSNDKTWSFWDTNPTLWNPIIHKSWENASVLTSDKEIHIELHPYRYHSIRAIDFYNDILKRLDKHENFHFIHDKVISVEDNQNVLVTTNSDTYSASHVFDSRIPDDFNSNDDRHISIIQHFKGWVIQTDRDTFDDNQVVMMDYRLKDGEQTTFTYVLPFSKRQALVEFTYFTSDLVDEAVYDTFIQNYINTYLDIKDYSIVETEMGQIPMTTFDFSKYNTKHITKIGTGGGWVKGSTGYSFKMTQKKVTKIIENIKSNRLPSHKLFQSKYRFYDKVFLKVLKDENNKGDWVFSQFYHKNSTTTMFRFLDEESSLLEDLKIMTSLFSWSFIKAFFKTL